MHIHSDLVDDIILSCPSKAVAEYLRNSFCSKFKMDDRGDLSWFLGIMHIGKYTRPNILNAVNHLSRFLDKPNMSQWVASKHVLRYLKGTADLKLKYYKDSTVQLVGSANADWNGALADRRSTTGYYFKLDGPGGTIRWAVKKQQTVALSSCEAEYQSMAAVVQEALYLRQLLADLGIPADQATPIGEDNQACIKMCENPVLSKRTKHIDTKYHFIRERVADNTVSVYYVPTTKMAADLLTKPLPWVKVYKHRTTLLGSDSRVPPESEWGC